MDVQEVESFAAEVRALLSENSILRRNLNIAKQTIKDIRHVGAYEPDGAAAAIKMTEIADKYLN